MSLIRSEALFDLACAALRKAGASEAAASSTARALVWADCRGIETHGVSRLPVYLSNLRHGRVDGSAQPVLTRQHGATLLVDACDGFAYPALELLTRHALERLEPMGVVFGAVRNSHHFGAASYHLREIGAAGKVGFLFGNTPAAMPAWGGRRPLFGTNPLAAVFPRREAPPLLIDLSLSVVTKGRIALAARDGHAIPEGWALDRDGRSTTDAQRAMSGMLCPAGGVKGSLLAMMIELLCAALTGSSFAYEADTFFVDEGNRARIAQTLLLLDPAALAGQQVYWDRVDDLVSTMLEDDDVRLPGSRGEAAAEVAARCGVDIPDALLQQISA